MRKSRYYVLLALLPFLFLFCSADKESGENKQIKKAFELGEKFRENLYLNLAKATPADYEKALTYYKTAQELSPYPSKKKASEAATAEDSQILELTNQAYFLSCDLLANQKEYDRIIALATGYLAGFKENDLNRQLMTMRRAVGFDMKGETDSALANYQRVLDDYALTFDRQNPNAEILGLPTYLVTLHMRRQDFTQEQVKEAAGYYRKLTLTPPSDPLSSAAMQATVDLYLRNNQFPEALATLESMTDSTGQVSVGALMAIGDLYLSYKNEFALSRKTFERILKLYSKNELVPFARFGIGKSYFGEKNYAKAVEVYRKLMKDYPANTRIQAATYMELGLCQYQTGNWTAALRVFDSLIAGYPESPEGMRAVGLVGDYYRSQGNSKLSQTYFEKAEQTYQGVLAKSPGTDLAQGAFQMLLQVYFTREQWKEAAQELEKMIPTLTEGPAQADMLILLGQLYEEQLKDPVKANQTYANFLMKYPQDPRSGEALDRAKRLSLGMQDKEKKAIEEFQKGSH